MLLGATPIHQLQDAFRIFLKQNPDLWKQLCDKRPSGPLAISHVRGRGEKRTPCRYDFIYVSTDVRVNEVEYLYEEAIAAGSDHALVIGSFDHKPRELPKTLQPPNGTQRVR